MRSIFIALFLTLSPTLSATTPSEVETVVLDVRTQAEYDRGHVVGAKLIDFNSPDFAVQLKKLDRNKAYKVYCAVGGRAGKAEKLMREMGFKNVENLGGVKEAAKKLLAKCEGPSISC